MADVKGEHDETLLGGRGDPIWNPVIGEVALSPQGLVAFSAREYDAANPYHPRSPLHLELFDLDAHTPRRLSIDVQRTRLSWHPDGRRLILARWNPPPDANTRSEPGRISLLDVDTGEESEPIGRGDLAFAQADGRCVWIGRYDDPNWLVVALDSGTGAIHACSWRTPLAAADGLILAEANPTTGSGQHYLWTIQKFPQAMWTIKLFDAGTCEFLTVAERIARFHVVSFGAR